jgi:hypothetical protein
LTSLGRKRVVLERSEQPAVASVLCYEDKIGRRGIRLMELLDKDCFARKLLKTLKKRIFYLKIS